MAKQKRYSREFKLGAVRLVIEQGYSQKEAGRRLGVAPCTIRYWIQKFEESGDLPGGGKLTPEGEEMRKLRDEVSRLQMENEILKKAAAYFAKESL